MNESGFIRLPDEVIQNILAYATPADALSLELTARRFRDITNEPQLWKSYCHKSFHNWSGDYGIRYRLPDPAVEEWKRLYASRITSSLLIRKTLNEIIQIPLGRIDRVNSITAYSLDIKDDLLNLLEKAPHSENHLAQKYWAHVSLGCLHRSLAVDLWLRLKFREDEDDSFEKSLGAFDLFILSGRRTGDIADIFAQIDAYAREIRATYPHIDSLSPQAKATLIAAHLLERQYIGISQERHYHSIDHMFLGVALYSDLRNSLPLISAVIYCAVARRFNLQAAPCSFPFNVHAIIRPPAGFDLHGNPLPTPTSPPAEPVQFDPSVSTTLYMDPFHTSEPATATSLAAQLAFIARQLGRAFDTTQTASFLSPASPRDITTRAAFNIQNSPQQSPPPPLFPIPQAAAAYAASWALVLLPTATLQLRRHVDMLFNQFVSFASEFSYDLPLIETHILPLTASFPQAQRYREYAASLREEDTTPKTPKRHSDPANRTVKYKIGQVFRHRTRGYLACITGWDPNCNMPDEWIAINQVGRLERGRGQPFYNVIVEDTTARYVAEDNVVLLPGEETSELDVETIFPIEIGRHYKRWDAGKGVFISNMLDEYPED